MGAWTGFQPCALPISVLFFVSRFVCGEVLGNPARLALNYICFADIVEQGRFAVVDVSHDCDYRRAVHTFLFCAIDSLAFEIASFSSPVSSNEEEPFSTGLA